MSVPGSRLDSSAQRVAMTCQGQTAKNSSAARPKRAPRERLASSHMNTRLAQPESATGRRSVTSLSPKIAMNGMAR